MTSASSPPTLESALGRPRGAVLSGWGSLDRTLFAAAALAGGPFPGGETLDAPRAPQAPGGPSGLVRGGVHEWFGTGDPHEAWAPPLFLLGHLAARAVHDASERGASTHVLWIGRCVWPYPRTLNGGVDLVEVDRSTGEPRGAHQLTPLPGSLLGFDLELREVPERFSLAGGPLFERSLFVDPGSGPTRAGQRLWAIDAALRCPSVTAIVADGSGLAMAATRRLQLAAAAAEALVLLARPPAEIGEVSAATTRWIVKRPQPLLPEGSNDEEVEPPERADFANETGAPRWCVELLRAKGSQGLR